MTLLDIEEDYAPHRDIYRRLHEGLESVPGVLDELLGALGLLISEYDTTVRENRFIAGGATERMLATAMRSVGIADAQARGLEPDDEDISVGPYKISVKGSFTGRKDQITLVNSRGISRGLTWATATIFVLANRGIGYADPALLPNEARRSGGELNLRRAPLDVLHEAHPQWLLPCDVPAKSQDTSQRRAASEAVATEILQRTAAGRAMFPRLRGSL